MSMLRGCNFQESASTTAADANSCRFLRIRNYSRDWRTKQELLIWPLIKVGGEEPLWQTETLKSRTRKLHLTENVHGGVPHSWCAKCTPLRIKSKYEFCLHPAQTRLVCAIFCCVSIAASVKCVLHQQRVNPACARVKSAAAGLFVCSMPRRVHIADVQINKYMYNWLMMLCELCEFKMYKNALVVQQCKIVELVVCVCAVSCFPLRQNESGERVHVFHRCDAKYCSLSPRTSCQRGRFCF
jgi:hypothetical protein